MYNGTMVKMHTNSSGVALRATETLRRLEQKYGRPEWNATRTPLEELVITILSQHTSDTNCERAFDSLRAALPSWRDVADADKADIADAIRVGGLADVKAPRIKAVVNSVLEDGMLDDLPALPLEDAKLRLTSLPGVGPKTAACVLLFACHRPALPVDTHVHRVSTRIGLIRSGTSAEQAHSDLESLLAPEDVYSFHLNVIRLGREICRARAPKCVECCLQDICDYANTAGNGER